MKSQPIALIVAILFPATLFAGEQSSDAVKPVLRIAFFTPSDVDPPDGVRERVKQIVDYAQTFYTKWLKHWGYDCNQALPVERDEEGYPVIHFVRGKHTLASGRYNQHGFQPEVVRAASQQGNVPPQGQVWWIFVYNAVENGWGRGGGNFQRGGVATGYVYTVPGEIKTTDELASEFLVEIKLKGVIHELGHALGLPHIGPRQRDNLGNSLMGPINKVYFARANPNEARVHLSEASAAMLWKHPLLSGTVKDRDRIPKAQLVDFQATYDRDDDHLIITGKLESDYPAHSVVVANGSTATPSPYWLKCFVGRVTEDGTFRVEIDKLEHADGLLKIVFCFDNGAIVGEFAFRAQRWLRQTLPFRRAEIRVRRRSKSEGSTAIRTTRETPWESRKKSETVRASLKRRNMTRAHYVIGGRLSALTGKQPSEGNEGELR